MAFTAIFTITKSANVAWFSSVYPIENYDDNELIENSTGFVGLTFPVLTQTEHVAELVFDTKENYLNMMNNRRQTYAYQLRYNYFVENLFTTYVTYQET